MELVKSNTDEQRWNSYNMWLYLFLDELASASASELAGAKITSDRILLLCIVIILTENG